MKQKNITINDIAKSLNVSPSTVSRALNNNIKISEETRKLVQEKAAELGYEINLIASSLSKEKTGIIGLIVPSINRYFFSQTVSGIESLTQKMGYHLIIAQSDESFEREIALVKMFGSYRVDGIIACLTLNTSDVKHFENFINKKTPIVLFDRVNYGLDCTKVVVDNFEGAYKATEHLISSGCRRPALLGGPMDSKLFNDRANGFKEALKNNNIPLLPNFLLSTDLTARDVHDAMAMWMKLPEPPDGVFTASASTGLILSQIAKNYQLKIPDDLALITFGNEPCHEYITPSMSAIEMPGYNMGCTAAKHLFNEIENRRNEKKIVIEPLQLIIRNSTLKSVKRPSPLLR